MRVTFKKEPPERFSTTKFYRINVDGQHVGTIQSNGPEWFWYGEGRNTICDPEAARTLEGCKAEAKAYFLNLARN